MKDIIWTIIEIIALIGAIMIVGSMILMILAEGNDE